MTNGLGCWFRLLLSRPGFYAARKDLELLELRERMREAQSSVSELAAEVATFKFQGEHYAAVFRDNEELKAKLKEAEVGHAWEAGWLAGEDVW